MKAKQIYEKLHNKGYYVSITDIEMVLKEICVDTQITKKEAQLIGYCKDCKTKTCQDMCLLIDEIRAEKRKDKFFCPKCNRISFPNYGRCVFCG